MKGTTTLNKTEKRKAVNLELFRQRSGRTHISNAYDVNNVITNISGTEGSIGLVVNSRNIMFSLGYKSFKIDFGGKVSYTAFKPTDTAILDYIPLGNVTKERWDEIYAQGDSVKNRSRQTPYHKDQWNKYREATTDSHLVTTKEHELSILVQMAVDDSKFGFLGQVGVDNNFMVSRIFKGSDGKPASGVNQLKVLSIVRSVINTNPIRQGIDPETRKKLSLEDIFEKSTSVSYMLSGDNIGSRFKELVNSELDSRKITTSAVIQSISMRNRKTPQEEIISRISSRLDRHHENININANMPITYYTESSRIAHMQAAKEMHLNHLKWLKKYGRKDMEVALDLMNRISDDYYAILKKKDTLKYKKRLDKNDPLVEIGYDFDEDIAELIDNYYEDFHNLTSKQQMLATFYFLEGTMTRNQSGNLVEARYRLKILPLKLLHRATMKEYFKAWAGRIREIDPVKDKKSITEINKWYSESGVDLAVIAPQVKDDSINTLLNDNLCG